MPRYLFSLGLVPVQGFIAEARRSRDLRAGSVFLWWAMARVLGPVEGGLRLPRLPADRTLAQLGGRTFGEAMVEPYGIPNRASGWFAAAGDEAARGVFAGMETRLSAAWAELRNQAGRALRADDALASVLGPSWASYEQEAADGRDVPVRLVWAARRALAAQGEPASSEYEAVDALYDAAKRSRLPEPWPGAAPVGKCNQCGRREALGPRDSFQKWQQTQERLAAVPSVRRGGRLEQGERLCPVCLVKRYAGYLAPPHAASREEFPSTGDVAAARWLAAVEGEPRLKEVVDRLRRAARESPNGDLGRALYSSLAQLDREGSEAIAACRRKLHAEIHAHNQRLGAAGRRWHAGGATGAPLPLEPPPYLALLAFDGDDMGEWVARDPETASRQLLGFATSARRLLAFSGRRDAIFYLAGDEGLAMLPLEAALDVALRLRQEFAAALAAARDKPTLSMGLAFFEQSRPLGAALATARAALAEAKSRPGKDALAVRVETASGNRWGFMAAWGETWQRLIRLAELVARGELAGSFAYDAERLVQELPDDLWASPEGRAAARSELQRLFVRRLDLAAEPGGPRDRRGAIERRREAWRAVGGDTWWEEPASPGASPPPPDPAPEQFHLLGFLSRTALAIPAPSSGEND